MKTKITKIKKEKMLMLNAIRRLEKDGKQEEANKMMERYIDEYIINKK